ncbi:vesicular inhibitory amino acid transporter-like [Actinia tenebrosa]|uniref:Vesicular inhibitory amino acid transporter-like n=1 Tax=Actinia tenebrosa TaxID=6105 RepID=A0A6P8H2V3_ACTTE|nr:vesicular inhibitory amino acid transporter-like [Actinia tenebrosa]
MWIIVGAVGVLPTIFLKHLSRIAWVSLLGVVVLMVPIGFVLWHGFSHASSWRFENLLFWDSQGFFVAFGIIVFSYTAHPALPRLEGCMIYKKSFSKVLGFSFLFVTLIKVVFALTSFLKFVGLTQEVVLNNFPVNILYHVICVFLSLNVLCSYAFPVSVVDQVIQESIASDSCLHRLPRMLSFSLTRLFLLFVTLVTALVVPHFALLLAFFGSMIASLFSFVFPCLFHLKLKGASLSWCIRFCNVSIILLGIFSAVLGTFFSGKALVEIYQ